MTRNDSETTADDPREQAIRRHQEYMASPAGARHRQPMTWPMAFVLLGLFGALVVVAWLCSGVATEWVRQ